MSDCEFEHGACDLPATTTLVRNGGEIVQLCEKHREETIRLLKKLAEDSPCPEADHWFILNKIPV